MPQLLQGCFNSDDELPELGVLLGRQSDSMQGRSLKPPTTASPKKEGSNNASTSKRRVRRLGGENRDVLNPLFHPWNSESEDKTKGNSRISAQGLSSRRWQLPSQEQVNSSKQSEQLEAQFTGIPSSRQPKTNSRLDDDSIQGMSQHNSTSTARPRALRDRGMPSSKAVAETSTKTGKDNSIEDIRCMQTTGLRRTKPTQSKLDSKPEHRIPSDTDEESLYQTAAELSSEYSDGDELDLSFDASLDDSPAKLLFMDSRKVLETKSKQCLEPGSSSQPHCHPTLKGMEAKYDPKITTNKPKVGRNGREKLLGSINDVSGTRDLVDTFSELQLNIQDSSDEEAKRDNGAGFTVPSLTPPRITKQKGLLSPRKQARIPDTPHRPSVDAFWRQDFVDDWNDQHSPVKPTQPRLPVESSVKKNLKKETKRSFGARKHQLAEEFLRELDTKITDGKIAKLAESTGGVKIVWTKTLNTTAGRANWRLETTRNRQAGGDSVQQTVQYKHHACIELAEKVIDDEHRLLNVLAHEFCHLANFMVNGITNNPHGKEFKVWASKCSQAFGAQGIKVTTKHTYEIDFKYIWTCTACGSQYKRHSKSIDIQRHRCGNCKGALTQTKPVPRGAGAGSKPSEYQIFMKEQMKIVRSENPGSPQKEVMKIIANRWAKRDRSKETMNKVKIDGVVAKLVDLSLKE